MKFTKNMFQLKIILEMFRSLFYDKHVFSLQYYCATGVSPWFQGDLSPEVSVLEATGDILPHKIAIGTATIMLPQNNQKLNVIVLLELVSWYVSAGDAY